MTCDDDAIIEKFVKVKANYIAKDKDDNFVFLAETPFLLQMAQSDYPEITFHTNSDFKV